MESISADLIESEWTCNGQFIDGMALSIFITHDVIIHCYSSRSVDYVNTRVSFSLLHPGYKDRHCRWYHLLYTYRMACMCRRQEKHCTKNGGKIVFYEFPNQYQACLDLFKCITTMYSSEIQQFREEKNENFCKIQNLSFANACITENG